MADQSGAIRPMLSATFIAKNEAQNVKRCLDSIWDHVDEVVVCDTGSTDGTVEALKAYARERKDVAKLKIVHYEWTDDFAAARQVADDAATGEWFVWADFDDTIQGLPKLREYAANASSDIVAFFVRYKYAQDPDGNAISELWRERVVRNNGTKWAGRLHEHKIFTHGSIVRVGPNDAEWIHHRDHTIRSGERNLRILEQWLEDEPENPRVIQSIAMEHMGMEQFEKATDMFARYLQCSGETPDRRAQATRHMCVMLMQQNRVHEAKIGALNSLAETWTWADTHLTMAEVEQTLGNPKAALIHAQTAIGVGQPDTLLIINPLQYSAHPRAVMGVCLAQMGRWEEAVEQGEMALKVAPSYVLAAQYVPLWRLELRKQRTIASWLACADLLIEVGEVLKAKEMLATIPFFVTDDSQVIRKRMEVLRLVRERTAGSAAVVDEAADQLVERMAA